MSVRVEKGIRPKHRNHETRQEESVPKKTMKANVRQNTRHVIGLPRFLIILCLYSFQIRLLLPVSFRTLPFSLAVFVPQKTRSVDDRCLEIERTREHVRLRARSTEAPLGVKGRRGWQESIRDKPGRKGRNGRFDVVAAVVRLTVGVGIVHRRMGPRKRIGRSLGAGAEDCARAGRWGWQHHTRRVACIGAGLGGGATGRPGGLPWG